MTNLFLYLKVDISINYCKLGVDCHFFSLLPAPIFFSNFILVSVQIWLKVDG